VKVFTGLLLFWKKIMMKVFFEKLEWFLLLLTMCGDFPSLAPPKAKRCFDDLVFFKYFDSKKVMHQQLFAECKYLIF
jgi:hypothetical protein